MALPALNRKQVKVALAAAGWPKELHDTMVSIAAAESSLRVDVTGPKNSDGTEDYGLFQINSRYVAGAPKYDKVKLLSDATYNATAALAIYKQQGLGAWVAWTSGAAKRYLPPYAGGPVLEAGSPAWFLVVELQNALNAAGAQPQLVADGAFGPKTEAALEAYQTANPLEPYGVAGALYAGKLIP